MATGGGKFLGSPAQIVTQKHVDPLKQNIASPLSSFLADEMGKGLPKYSGELVTPIGEATEQSVGRFLDLDPETFFEEKIKAPALETFKEDLLPLTREQFAGSLSSSGRFRTEEESASRFTRGLAETRADLELNLPQAQLQVAQSFKETQDKDKQVLYQDWFSSLPQNNPALISAISFLNESTSSGTTLLSALDPGSKGWFGDLLGAIGGFVGAGGGGTTSSTGGTGGDSK